MNKAFVCHGDSTTTGGRVIAMQSSMFDAGRRIALDHETATCGNCPGEHYIQASGTETLDGGVATVLDRDAVHCACGDNYVLAAADCGCSTG
jgi:uncharacterized Zn-binding protein involved in type VI secretion